MRRVRFRDPAGSIRMGEWTDDNIEYYGETYDPSVVDVLPPSDPSKIVCVGLNYQDHVEEIDDAERPDMPRLSFVKPPSTLAAHGDTVDLPAEKDRIDHEAELGVVVSTQCRRIDAADAMDVVAGYTCVNEISNRDDQWGGGGFIRAKALDNSAPIGPVLVPPENVPEDAAIRLRVNGDLRQDSTIDDMIYGVPEIIESVTEYVTLEPGDVISTGTPAGVAPMADGDHVAIEIEGVGTLEHSIRKR